MPVVVVVAIVPFYLRLFDTCASCGGDTNCASFLVIVVTPVPVYLLLL